MVERLGYISEVMVSFLVVFELRMDCKGKRPVIFLLFRDDCFTFVLLSKIKVNSIGAPNWILERNKLDRFKKRLRYFFSFATLRLAISRQRFGKVHF